jgi:tRNA nucleotidyltransferase (CCA-adding enzyme)
VVDVASARRERYPRPGALPEVELGAGIREDLERRDFTVNAMAVPVAGGEPVVHPLAEGDLRDRLLRVLHDASFRDDPTRLLRMARYAARLGFAPDEHTAALADAAVASGALGTVTGSRIGAELRLLVGEPQPAGLLGLAAHGVGEALLGTYAPDREAIRGACAATPPDADAGVVALAAALASGRCSAAHDPAAAAERSGTAADPPHGAEEAIRARLAALAFPSRERDAVARAAAAAPGIGTFLATDPRPSATWERLRRELPEAVAVAAGLVPAARGAATRWLDEIRHVRPRIDGADLTAAGLSGPAVGRGLEAALRARLDGRAADRAAELAAALATARS